MTRRGGAAILFALVAVAAVGPIRSYDYFWNLTAGRWIVEHHAIPLFDPLAVASAHIPWINGEWLYQIVLYALHGIAGDGGISIVSALLAAAIFTTGFVFASREQEIGVALFVAAIAFAGASDRLGVRPAAAAALLIVVALGLLGSRLRLTPLTIAYACLTIVWINVHPSALLAPVLAMITMLIDVRRWVVAAASAAALLVNPFGWNAIIAPLRLTSAVRSGAFVNTEWLPSSFAFFPLLFVAMAVAVLLFIVAHDKRANAWRFVTFAILAALAYRYVRNQGLYFAALPLLIPPLGKVPRRISAILAVCTLLPLVWVFRHDVHRLGADDVRFPIRAAAALQSYQLGGNIYNADQFGGLLEWTFYPARRALTDGRNELFRGFIAEDAIAHHDSRTWHALIAKYGAVLAVDDYQGEKIEVVDMASGERRRLPASLVRYRRHDWALIAFDDAAMVFARRDAFPPARLAPIEYHFLVPDDPLAAYPNVQIRDAARKEIARAKAQFGAIRIVRQLESCAAAN
ncbi:MAG TPA: hypothetical protein VLC46_16200 [Thermoanaerobaculia bacterium]|jgi:hypothetical protein|nr:hypothetical protein [Thermoanaerobaculia bacterium]